ncbi:MAG: PAS domain S-box protein, partial [Sphingobacteriia bacterium]|nr:PAS domain S-box protein [Sphingobacteriia bacterium]
MLSDDMACFAIEHTPLELYWLDLAGLFVEANVAAWQALGYSREQLLGLAIWDVDPNFPPERWHSLVAILR